LAVVINAYQGSIDVNLQSNDDPIKVLLVERSPNDCLLIENLLSHTRGANFELHCVRELAEAERSMTEVEYAACLFEESLSEEVGLDQVRHALLARRDVPLVILTAREEYQPDVAAVRAGVLDYLVKSHLSADLLERAICYSIERKRIEKVLHQAAAEYTH
jgi:DNA-binding response OmpR family regulator